MMTWPLRQLQPNAVTFTANARSTSGSTSLSGVAQVVGSALGLWEARIVGVNLRDRVTARLWDAVELKLEGRMNPILVPVMEGRRQPFPASQPGALDPIPFDDGALFDDGSGFGEAVIDASLDAALARGAVRASIRVDRGRELHEADFFSIGDRLYRIRDIEDVAGAVQTVRFWPPAREAAAVNATIEFDRPACKMRLKSDTGMAVDKDFGKFATPTVEFVEDLS